MRTDTPAPRFASFPRTVSRAPRAAVAAVHPRRPDALAPAEMVHLCGDEIWSGSPGARGMRLRCTAGTLWVTQAGGAGDHIVRAGDAFVTAARGKVVVQTSGEASFRAHADA